MRVALVHDHLTQLGGAERVLEVLQTLWPHAPTFTLLYDEKTVGTIFGHKDIRPSFLQRVPGALRLTRWLLPFMPSATEHYPLQDYDVVISSASAFAKGVVTHADAVHICYCHTPTRYLWNDAKSYVDELHAPKFIKAFLPFLQSVLRAWDKIAADRVDLFVANSKTVQRRIKKFYGKESIVIYPPVSTSTFSISTAPKTSFLIGGRLVSYKRYDIVVQAFTRLGIPLTIFGSGPEEAHLKSIAGPNITFVGRITDDERARLFANAVAFIHPQEEDFGITPVESMAAGRPVIAYRKGGATETVVEGVTGVFFNDQTWECLAHTILQFDDRIFNPATIKAHAEQFSVERFRQTMHSIVENAWKEKTS
ncbi:MAG: glycosyltransferase [Patescibacteria group bacterium]|jgi:glycosyltransferase involved in cell wall biosynthesis